MATAAVDVRGNNYRPRDLEPAALLRLLFEQEQPYLTVEVQTIADGDRKLYEPVLKAIGLLKSWNAWDGPKVEGFVRDNLWETGKGPIISVRFGRAYSPVLYLTITGAVREGEGDYRKLKYRERQKLARDLIRKAKETIEPDAARLVAPGLVKLWWD